MTIIEMFCIALVFICTLAFNFNFCLNVMDEHYHQARIKGIILLILIIPLIYIIKIIIVKNNILLISLAVIMVIKVARKTPCFS